MSHGYQLPNKKISKVSAYFETLPYRLNEETGIIDYSELAKLSMLYRPKILIAGASSYPRKYDYGKMKEVRLVIKIFQVSSFIFLDCQ